MYLDELNQSQRDAVLCCDAPSLVIAGAGSGKTRVLTCKIAYLLEQGMSPWNILALTFTNKAASEMKQRVERQVGAERAAGLWMGTFHSVFGRILRMEADRIGFSPDYTVYDVADAKGMLRAIIREMGLDEKKYKPATVAARISEAKNSLVLPDAYRTDANRAARDEAQNMGRMPDIYARYMQRCRQSNAMDFDDMLLYTWLLLSGNADVAATYRERFHFVLVDEYQDTNYAQHRIVWLLTCERQRVCVVGDDAQSIYSFRGADIENILGFQQMYGGARLFKLEQNYRSTQNIVQAANSLIRHNRRQIRKDVYSRAEEGRPIEVCGTYSDVDESNLVVRKIRDFVRADRLRHSDIAVLYRTNAQSRSLEEALRRQGIPYRIYGGMSFYQRKEVKDLIAYLRLAVNHADEEALRRVINYPARGIGATTLDKIFARAAAEGVAPWQVVSSPEDLDVNAGMKARLARFAAMVETFSGYAATLDACECARRIIRESGMHDDVFRGSEPEDAVRQENLQEVLDGTATFVEERREEGEGFMLTHYLQEVSLLSDPVEDTAAGDDKVSLMTVHSAKGLEFAAVIVVGLEETLFPSQMCLESPRHIEEERRLFYVAMTRAGRYLVLTHARSRMRYGKTEFCEPSRFLAEIDPQCLSVSGTGRSLTAPRPAWASGGAEAGDHSGDGPFAPRTDRRPAAWGGSLGGGSGMGRQASGGDSAGRSGWRSASGGDSEGRFSGRSYEDGFGGSRSSVQQPSGFVSVRRAAAPASTAPSDPVRAGDVISHERFGMGRVVRVEGGGVDAKATVEFSNAGTKQLLLRFARFTVVGHEGG